MQDLKVTLIQAKQEWEDKDTNLADFTKMLNEIENPTDLIILPEMFTTGFSMDASSLAEPMNFTTFKWMQQQAAQTKAVVVGSYIVKEGEHYYNRLIWMKPDGTYAHYDKRHLFRMAGEDKQYTAGSELLIQDLKGWKVCPLICYDLRFPVWSRSVNLNYDLLLFIANWPKPRVNAWDTLLKARAIENLAYCVGVNRIGSDDNGLGYSGNSAIIDFKGHELFFNQNEPVIHTATLEYEPLKKFRDKFPVQMDADQFEVRK